MLPLLRVWLGLLAAALVVGCQPPGGGDDSGDVGDGSEGGTGGVPEPVFVNPALGEFTVVSTQHVPRDISVNDVALGNTQLLVDGQAAGPLGPGSALGELTDDRLRLYLHGALALGAHTLQLASSGDDGPRYSTELTMLVTPPLAVLPALRATLEPEPRGSGDALIRGSDPDALLGLLAAGSGPSLRLYRRDGARWADDPVAEVALDGYIAPEKGMSFGTDVAAVAVPPVAGSDSVAVRIAYRRGVPGDAILTRDLTFLPESNTGALETAVALSDALFADAEFAALGRPFFLGDTLVAEFLAAGDSEVAHPGDRGLALVRRQGGAWAAPERVPTPVPLDLDAAGSVLSLSTLPVAPALSVRVGRRQAGLLHLSDARAALLSIAGPDAAFPAGDPTVLTTITSSLGARTVAAVSHDSIALSFLGSTGDFKRRDAHIPAKDLPDAPLTAPPAAGVLLGYSLFLLPFGAAAPVHALLGDGDRVFVVTIAEPEPLFCRDLALMPGLTGNDDAAPTLGLACVEGGALRFGALRADPVAP